MAPPPAYHDAINAGAASSELNRHSGMPAESSNNGGSLGPVSVPNHSSGQSSSLAINAAIEDLQAVLARPNLTSDEMKDVQSRMAALQVLSAPSRRR
jgi:hypothetical protein